MSSSEAKNSVNNQEKKNITERAFERVDLQYEFGVLESMLEELRVNYEQYFLGVSAYEPVKLHNALKRQVRKLQKAPFKRSEHVFKLRSIESRYNTYNDYWRRILLQKENGTYVKDVFKARVREQNQLDAKAANTSQGAAAKQMQDLFSAYKNELERATGKKQNVDFQQFKSALIQKAKVFQDQNKDKRLSFKVVVKDGKVSIKATAKDVKPA
jgi:hypothetical protein